MWSTRSSFYEAQTQDNIDFYKVPQLYEFESFEVQASSEEALVDKWNQLWEAIQEVKSYKTILESKAMNLNDDDQKYEKVLIYFGKGNVSQVFQNEAFQLWMSQKLKSQMTENEEIPNNMETSVSVLIDNTSYPAKFWSNPEFIQLSEDIKVPKIAKLRTISTYHTSKVSEP